MDSPGAVRLEIDHPTSVCIAWRDFLYVRKLCDAPTFPGKGGEAVLCPIIGDKDGLVSVFFW